MNWSMIVFWSVIIFFGLIAVIGGSLFWIFWNRRKLIWTNFLSDTGQWEKKSWKPDKISKTFVYDNETYKYDIKKCTRDRINRPIAHYYKGNPEQQIFDFRQTNKSVTINSVDITAKDFNVLMLSKVLRDIFQDDEVMNLLYILIGIVAISGVATIILILTRNPDVTLSANNQTIAVITEGVRQAMGGRV